MTDPVPNDEETVTEKAQPVSPAPGDAPGERDSERDGLRKQAKPSGPSRAEV